MEAYWNLSSKRFIDNCCMMSDSDLLSNLPPTIQDKLYEFLKDDAKLEVDNIYIYYIQITQILYLLSYKIIIKIHYFHQTIFIEDLALKERKQEISQYRDKLSVVISKLNSIQSPAIQKFTVPPPATNSKLIKKTVEEIEDEEAINKTIEHQIREEEITVKVPIGEMGIGLIIVHDTNSSSVIIKGFRTMPYKKDNPSQTAGLKIGDRIKSINDTELQDHNHAVNLIKASLFEIKICIIRKVTE